MCNKNELEPIKSIMDSMASERTEKLREALEVIGCILSEFDGTTTHFSEKPLIQLISITTSIPKERVLEIFEESRKIYNKRA